MSQLANTLTAAHAGQLAERDPLLALIQRLQPQIERALPKAVPIDRFMRIALTEFRTNPNLRACTEGSILSALLRAGQLGLEPGGPLNEAHLVPFGDECTLLLDYRGEIKLARRSGEIADIVARTVYRGEPFRVSYGLVDVLEHVPAFDGAPGEAFAWYAIARFRGGGHVFNVLPRWEVERRRQRSRNKSGPAWTNDFDAMGNKSAIHSIARYLPLTPEAAGAIEDDEAQEYGSDRSYVMPEVGPGAGPELPPPPADTPAPEPERKPRGRPRRKRDDGGMYGPDGGPLSEAETAAPPPRDAPGPETPAPAAETNPAPAPAVAPPRAEQTSIPGTAPRAQEPYRERLTRAVAAIDAAEGRGVDRAHLVAAVTGKPGDASLTGDELIRMGEAANLILSGTSEIREENGGYYLTLVRTGGGSYG